MWNIQSERSARSEPYGPSVIRQDARPPLPDLRREELACQINCINRVINVSEEVFPTEGPELKFDTERDLPTRRPTPCTADRNELLSGENTPRRVFMSERLNFDSLIVLIFVYLVRRYGNLLVLNNNELLYGLVPTGKPGAGQDWLTGILWKWGSSQ